MKKHVLRLDAICIDFSLLSSIFEYKVVILFKITAKFKRAAKI